MALGRVYRWPNPEQDPGPSQRHKLSVSSLLGVSMACWAEQPPRNKANSNF